MSDESLARMRARPGFSDAVRRFAASMLEATAANPLLDGIIKDAGRNVAAMCTATLQATGGVTLPRLKAICGHLGLLSPGRARALLFYMRYLGYVTPAPTQTRGSPAVYLATDAFMTTWRSHQRRVLEAAALAEPAVTVLLAQFDDPAVADLYSAKQCEAFLSGVTHEDTDTPYFRVFLHRLAGIQIVHTLIAASPTFPPQAEIPLSIMEISKRFRVSHVHVRRLLDAAIKEGLLEMPRVGVVAFTRAGQAALSDIFARQMVYFIRAAGRTLDALREPNPRPRDELFSDTRQGASLA